MRTVPLRGRSPKSECGPSTEAEPLLAVEELLRDRVGKIDPDRAERRGPQYSDAHRRINEHVVIGKRQNFARWCSWGTTPRSGVVGNRLARWVEPRRRSPVIPNRAGIREHRDFDAAFLAQ